MPGVMKVDSWEDRHSVNSDYDPYLVHKDQADLDMRSSRSAYSNGYSSADQHSDFGAEEGPSYLLEHLATFSVGQQYALESPKDGLRKLFQMEKSKGIWTQKMKMKLDRKWVIIIDCENGDIVERFPMSLISDPTAFTSDDPRELYNNILVFVVQDDPTSSSQQEHAEMHIFQCVRISAKEVVDDIKAFMMGKSRGRRSSHDRGSGLPPPPNVAAPEPPVNGGINVREQVNIFNAAAVSQGSPPPPSHGPMLRGGPPPHDKIEAHHVRGVAGGYARESNDETSSTTSEKYERDVAILNHCFDDIERFIARLQHAAAAYRELERRRKSRKNKKKDLGDGMLSMRAKPPPEREFVDILQKFKLSFNLLAKLKNHIHEPNSPELVHFLFTPLAVIVDAARDCGRPGTGASLAARVVSPLLTRDALELLANCCTSKESDLWHSLGDAWVVPRDMWKGYESETYQPVFSDGWAPDCSGSDDQAPPPAQPPRMRRRSQEEVELRDVPDYHAHRGNVVSSQHDVDSRYGGSDYLNERVGASPYDRGFSPRADHVERPGTQTPSESDLQDPRDQRSELSVDSMEAGDPQRQWRAWADALRDQGAKIVQVVYPRTANNDKELTVVRGEFLEILDDSRKWWKTRNIRGQVGHVPHTIVTAYHSDDTGSVGGYEHSSSRENYNRSPYPPGGAFADMGLEGDSSPPHELVGDSMSSSGLGMGSPRGGGPRQPPAPADWVRRERQGKKETYNESDPYGLVERNIPPAPPLPPPEPPSRSASVVEDDGAYDNYRPKSGQSDHYVRHSSTGYDSEPRSRHSATPRHSDEYDATPESIRREYYRQGSEPRGGRQEPARRSGEFDDEPLPPPPSPYNDVPLEPGNWTRPNDSYSTKRSSQLDAASPGPARHDYYAPPPPSSDRDLRGRADDFQSARYPPGHLDAAPVPIRSNSYAGNSEPRSARSSSQSSSPIPTPPPPPVGASADYYFSGDLEARARRYDDPESTRRPTSRHDIPAAPLPHGVPQAGTVATPAMAVVAKGRREGSSNYSRPASQHEDTFDQELKLRVSLGPKSGKKWGKAAVASRATYITPESTAEEVQAWLTAKDFNERVKSLCKELTGEHMFALTKERLEEVLAVTEAARLISHLTVQKNLCGYKPGGKDQLSEILQQRRNRVEAGVPAFEEPPKSPTTTTVVVVQPQQQAAAAAAASGNSATAAAATPTAAAVTASAN
uniref:Putative epidermal growth factor receptor kinase substrate n=1 Tax=Amblyomma aureolatum TaxID=187763 RepID=A0A1E1X566_9ACAR